MPTITFKLTSDDPTASVSGLVFRHPWTKDSQPVNDGFIQIAPNVNDTVALEPGKYVFAYLINGDGTSVTIQVLEGATEIKKKPVDPAKSGFKNLWFNFEVK